MATRRTTPPRYTPIIPIFDSLEPRLLLDAAIVGRHLFYNNSALDGNDVATNASDDNAID